MDSSSKKPLTFYQRKLKSFFDRLDIHNRGYFTEEDYNRGRIERMARSSQFQDPQLLDSYSKFVPTTWQMWYEDMAKEVDGEKRVTLEDFLRVDFIKSNVNASADSLFDMADANKDGLIDLKEFEYFHFFWGSSKEESEFSFKLIDTNNDGFISREEFRIAGEKFFCDREDNEGKHFWGRFHDDENCRSNV